MAKKRNSGIRNVVVGDIIRRHPSGLRFETDQDYTELANKIYDIICNRLPSDFSREEAIEISADIAVYCEDIISGTHQFEAFHRLYQQMFHYSLPFYDSKDDDCSDFSLDSLRFVVWHSMMGQYLNRIINPFNQGVKMIAEGVLQLLQTELPGLPPNEELAAYLYSEEVQTDPIEVKKVLMWLMYDSYLGSWELHDSQEESLRLMLRKASDHMIDYIDRSLCAVKCRTWPLSLKAQTIYAQMIKIDMEDDNDELSLAIENLESAPFGLYHIMSCDDKFLIVQDYKGERYRVAIDSFDYNPQAEIERNHHTDVIASFISLDGRIWHVNGICSFTNETEDDFDAYCRAHVKANDIKERMEHQYDDIIKANHSDRLFFFKNNEAYLQWLKTDLTLKNVDDVDTSILPQGQPLTAFIEPSGNMTLNLYTECIKHPRNKFYDPIEARESGLQAFIDPDSCTPAMARYLLENKLLPDAMLNDVRGMDQGRLMLQDNIEFLARCIRRDIDSDEPFTTRRGTATADVTIDTSGKLPYNDFIDEISGLSVFHSRVYKPWHVIKASDTITIVKDDKGNKFTIPTRELYEAHLALAPKDITSNKVAPFLSTKKNASAATAILYNLVGTGKTNLLLHEMALKFMGRHH